MVSIETLYQHYLRHPVCIDTRRIEPGCLFFALRGANFDANTFASQALGLGAAYVVIDDENYAVNDKCILVDNVLGTLQELARHHRSQLNIPVIGLTGSNGKTTTKELIKAVLSEKYSTFATSGNLNNHIGVPLSVLAINKETEIAVIEMGANHQQEIAFLCEIARPTHGLITNVGMAHLDGFGGFEGVKKGKAELYAYLKKTLGYAFIYRDNPYLIEMSNTAALDKIVFYGSEKENAVSGKLKHSDPLIELIWANPEATYTAKVNLTGTYNFENILAAICIGDFFKVNPVDINHGLANYFPVNNRSQLQRTASNTVICDFYNANPSSMSAALENLSSLSAAHKAIIVGDMFELGGESPQQHENILALAQKEDFETRIFIGEHFYKFRGKYSGKFFISSAEATDYLKTHPLNENLVLLKGSRGMALEQLLPLL